MSSLRALFSICSAVERRSRRAELRREGRTLRGITLADGTQHGADVVVSDMEVIPACRKLVQADAAMLRR